MVLDRLMDVASDREVVLDRVSDMALDKGDGLGQGVRHGVGQGKRRCTRCWTWRRIGETV